MRHDPRPTSTPTSLADVVMNGWCFATQLLLLQLLLRLLLLRSGKVQSFCNIWSVPHDVCEERGPQLGSHVLFSNDCNRLLQPSLQWRRSCLGALTQKMHPRVHKVQKSHRVPESWRARRWICWCDERLRVTAEKLYSDDCSTLLDFERRRGHRVCQLHKPLPKQLCTSIAS